MDLDIIQVPYNIQHSINNAIPKSTTCRVCLFWQLFCCCCCVVHSFRFYLNGAFYVVVVAVAASIYVQWKQLIGTDVDTTRNIFACVSIPCILHRKRRRRRQICCSFIMLKPAHIYAHTHYHMRTWRTHSPSLIPAFQFLCNIVTIHMVPFFPQQLRLLQKPKHQQQQQRQKKYKRTPNRFNSVACQLICLSIPSCSCFSFAQLWHNTIGE